MICPNPQLQVQVEVNSIFVTRFLTQGTLMRVGLVGFVIADDFVSFEASFGLPQVPPRVIGVLYWPRGYIWSIGESKGAGSDLFSGTPSPPLASHLPYLATNNFTLNRPGSPDWS